MTKNFWEKLKKRPQPILALAPMAGFTDSTFRQICRKYGADVLYSEMVSAAGLYYHELSRLKGKKSEKSEKLKNKTLELIKFNRQKEKYYIVQLFGSDPKHFKVAAEVITKKIKPDGIDINFGCPVAKVVKNGGGCGLMKRLDIARAVIEAVLEGTNLPVSIKIRAGVGDIDALKFLKNISDLPVAAVMIHGRTYNQGFSGSPDAKIIKQARRYFKGIILANGGVNDLAGARKFLQESGADGLGLARGILGKPWLFKEIKTKKPVKVLPAKIFKLIIDHGAAIQKIKGKPGIIELRKHLVWYVSGLPGAVKLREKLVKANNVKEIKEALLEK